METSVFVYGELRHEIQKIVNVLVRTYGNDVLQQGCYSVRDLEILLRKDAKFIALWDAALELAYPGDGHNHEIKLEYGTFRCIVPAHMFLAIGRKFEAQVPKRKRGAAICADLEYCQEAA